MAARRLIVGKTLIIAHLQGISQSWIDGLDNLYQEVINNEGEGSHLISSS
eukprot:TRINITY_DN6263_c0_g1_i2.p2 TRINITY_DN6263_c0_g1~~TRINITY_DN6263_c0_g1_i2.p2  ORF type:complete len:50 (-),score=7.93 TRINITY_DN6263_c0_g1_i2:108-257(-)